MSDVPLEQNYEKHKRKNVMIIDDSTPNNIYSRRTSNSKNVFINNFPFITNENIVDKIQVFWKIHSDRLFLLAEANDLIKNINSLGNLKKFRKKKSEKSLPRCEHCVLQYDL